jgi:hypothetical protein
MKKAVLLRIVMGVMVAAWISPPVFAQEYRTGEILTARVNLPLREAPPSGLLHTMSPQTGELRAGDKVRVIDTAIIRTLFSTFIWIKIEKVDPPTRPEDNPGASFFWVLAQETGEQPYFERED